MKTTIFTFLFFSSLFILSSCSNCKDCGSCPEGVTLDQTEICKKDFDSKDDYDQAVAVIEAFGCECD